MNEDKATIFDRMTKPEENNTLSTPSLTADPTDVSSDHVTKPEKGDIISVLFLAADPTDASRLRLGEEFREIQQQLRQAKYRDRFKLCPPQMAARPADLTQALLDEQPQIVHFAGHGTDTGELCLENQIGELHPIQPDALAALFERFAKQVICVVLNACYSEIQAHAIGKHIDYVIGMKKVTDDRAAIVFAAGFYQALGADCTLDFDDAYKLGCARISLEVQGITEHPVLIKMGQAQS